MSTIDPQNSPVNASSRDDWLKLDDQKLIQACRFEVKRGSGPGGQKRNKTSSAVRLLHEPTGLSVEATRSRSQAFNKRAAARRLRLLIAMHDAPTSHDPPASPAPSPAGPAAVDWDAQVHSPAFALTLASVFDALRAEKYSLRQTAAKLGISSGRLSRFLTTHPAVLNELNRRRATRGLHPLSRR